MVWFGIGGFILGMVAVFALWRVSRLQGELAQFKRETYYNANRFRESLREINDSVEALKIQLEGVASGSVVPKDLIRSGRLYWELSPGEAENIVKGALQTTPSSRDLVLVDVGTQKEFKAKHLPGARWIPFEELERRFQTEIPREVARVILYCARGDRSRLACDFLSRQGYLNVYLLVGGLQHWAGPTIERESFQLIQIQSKSKELC